jgi:hypothetical protein
MICNFYFIIFYKEIYLTNRLKISYRNRKSGSLMKSLVLFAIYSHFIFNLAITGGFLYISKLNYPGGNALMKLHELEPRNTSNNIFLKPN